MYCLAPIFYSLHCKMFQSTCIQVNFFFNHMAIYKNLICLSQENLSIKALFAEIGVYLQLTVKQSQTSINSCLFLVLCIAI